MTYKGFDIMNKKRIGNLGWYYEYDGICFEPHGYYITAEQLLKKSNVRGLSWLGHLSLKTWFTDEHKTDFLYCFYQCILMQELEYKKLTDVEKESLRQSFKDA